MQVTLSTAENKRVRTDQLIDFSSAVARRLLITLNEEEHSQQESSVNGVFIIQLLLGLLLAAIL